jgi:hypothetical protein
MMQRLVNVVSQEQPLRLTPEGVPRQEFKVWHLGGWLRRAFTVYALYT